MQKANLKMIDDRTCMFWWSQTNY